MEPLLDFVTASQPDVPLLAVVVAEQLKNDTSTAGPDFYELVNVIKDFYPSQLTQAPLSVSDATQMGIIIEHDFRDVLTEAFKNHRIGGR